MLFVVVVVGGGGHMMQNGLIKGPAIFGNACLHNHYFVPCYAPKTAPKSYFKTVTLLWNPNPILIPYPYI